jgi:hypothetical protein
MSNREIDMHAPKTGLRAQNPLNMIICSKVNMRGEGSILDHSMRTNTFTFMTNNIFT